MKYLIGTFLGICLVVLLSSDTAIAQCSICTKTASQLGEGPAKALNSAIIYLAFTPFAIIGARRGELRAGGGRRQFHPACAGDHARL